MKNLSSKRAWALSITSATKQRVWERDEHCCIWCGSSNAFPECHYIPRARGGLGIEQNIVTGCRSCHDRFDNGDKETREAMKAHAKETLMRHYPDWNELNLVYTKEY